MCRRRTFRFASILAVIGLVASAVPVAAQSNGDAHELMLSITKAPVVPNGTSAGAPTDLVITFADLDPSVDGIGIKEGGTIEVQLPNGFTRTGPDPRDTIVVLQGWPQSPPAPPPAFPWTFDIVDNTITTTFTANFLPGTSGPGPKQIHLLLYSFQNPTMPGPHPVELTIQPDPESNDTYAGHGSVFIHSSVLPSVAAVSVFSGPPGPPPPFFNPIYQTVAQGDAARQVGLYLWERGGSPMTGVSLQQTSSHHALLMQNGSAVGDVWIAGPGGAWDVQLSANGPSGGPVSEELPAFFTGVPTGVLIFHFRPDPGAVGDYTVRIRMNGGLGQDLHVTVVPSSVTVVRSTTDESAIPASHSRLTRFADGVAADLATTGLEPGSAYTMWWVVFNHPEHCVNGCDSSDVDDVPAVDGTILWADGGVVGDSGEHTFAGFLAVDSDPIVDVRKGTGVLTNPLGAEIHLVIRNHGPAIEGLVDQQTSTFSGGCDANGCVNEQFAIHPPAP